MFTDQRSGPEPSSNLTPPPGSPGRAAVESRANTDAVAAQWGRTVADLDSVVATPATELDGLRDAVNAYLDAGTNGRVSRALMCALQREIRPYRVYADARVSFAFGFFRTIYNMHTAAYPIGFLG